MTPLPRRPHIVRPILALILVMLLARVALALPQQQSPAPQPRFTDLTDTCGYPAADVEWDELQLQALASHDQDGAMEIHFASPVPFTSLSLGWDLAAGNFCEEDFAIGIRSRDPSNPYGPWFFLTGESSPEENPRGMYWSELYMTPDEGSHCQFEIRITPPEGAAISRVRVSLADLSSPEGVFTLQEMGPGEPSSLAPQIIPRSAWWGTLPQDQIDAPGWLPQAISPSHCIVHHTVTQNNPQNPAQAVRNIWHYHAVTLGWGDIGYNFLIDQYGNIFQGRYNPWLFYTDTRAGHAGLSNPKSFGVSFLGQFQSTVSSPAPVEPTAQALASLEDLIAWRFYQYNLDPFERDYIETKRYGFIEVPRISGHRDVAATLCPGDLLYLHLPCIAENVKEKITNHIRTLSGHTTRIFGPTRYETAVEISRAGWPHGSETVLLARGDDFADALAAVPLAYRLNAPILLTPNSRLAEAVIGEICRLEATNAIILGSAGAISLDVEELVAGMGLDVKRIAGINRYETAVGIAEELIALGAEFETAFITAGTDFPDTLSASAYAAQKGLPILMTRKDSLPQTTVSALEDMGIKNTLVIGGMGVISEEVFNRLPNSERIYGSNRYATSVALAERFLTVGQGQGEDEHEGEGEGEGEGESDEQEEMEEGEGDRGDAGGKREICLATGLDFPDAITGAVLAARKGTGVVLVQGGNMIPNLPVRSFLIENRFSKVTLFGGEGVLSRNMELWLQENL